MQLWTDLDSKHVYCLGIGGVGVGAIAEYLHSKGCCVTGSDRQPSSMTIRLQSLGIDIFNEHAIELLDGVDYVVYSSAISLQHPVLVAAVERDIPVVKRGELLAHILCEYDNIVVAGTHGKTTTTAILAHLFKQLGLAPGHFIGGVINGEASPVALGAGQYMIAEADESDASFLFMKPKIAIVTNIDADHLESYRGDFEELKRSFKQFISHVVDGGVAIVCIDHPVIRAMLPEITVPIVTYGFSEDADVRASCYQQQELRSSFTLMTSKAQVDVSLNMPGQHNVLNALACIAVVEHLNIEVESILAALSTFPGVGRRLQLHGNFCHDDEPISIFEDYGHHPEEIAVTITTLRQAWPDRRLVMAFQPHRYSRTQQLLEEFAVALAQVDVLLLLDIYAAGEKPIAGVNSAVLASRIRQHCQLRPVMVQDSDILLDAFRQHVVPGDMVVFQGAGSVGGMAREYSLDLDSIFEEG